MSLWALLLACGPATPEASEPSRSEQLVSTATSRWVLEIDAVGERALRESTLEAVVEVLEPLVEQPIVVELDQRDLEGALLWNADALRELADSTAQPEADDAFRTQILLLDGRYTQSALGAAWDQQHIAVFTDALELACDVGGEGRSERVCAAAEAAVVLHELGHIVGLVNNGVPMVDDHEDAGSPRHDSRTDCVMQAHFESPDMSTIAEQEPAGFCEACQADLAALRVSVVE